MHAKNHSLEVVFSQRQQWVVPIYQRDYAWSSEPNEQLPKIWEDIQERAEEIMGGKGISPHFVGAIIYALPDEPQPFGAVLQRFIVDGQQRITTCKLVLCAVKEIAHDMKLSSIVDLIDPYLFNPIEKVMEDPKQEHFKLWPSSVDRKNFISLSKDGMSGLRKNIPEKFDENGKLIDGDVPEIISAYCFLVKEIRAYLESDQHSQTSQVVLSSILKGLLSGFHLVVVQLGKKDDPQSIYASLNGNAKPLSAFNLIRNDIFHRASKSQEVDENMLYEDDWKTFEDPFWLESVKRGRLKRPRTDHLIAHTLVAEMARKIDVSKVAKEYQRFSKERNFETVQEEVDCLMRYAAVYESLEKHDKVKPEYQISEFLKIWDISAFHPLILWVGTQDINKEEKWKVYNLLEKYLVRRDVCDQSRQNYNNVIPSIIRKLVGNEDENIYSCVLNNLLSLNTKSSSFPIDTDIKDAAETFQMYKRLSPMKIRYILFRIENGFKFTEGVSERFEDLSVEHVIPQKWDKAKWPLPKLHNETNETTSVAAENLGEAQVQEETLIAKRNRLIHTIGNLTLITDQLNSSNSNSGWEDKKVRLNKYSNLKLNRQLIDKANWTEWNQKQNGPDDWNEVSIVERSKYLYRRIIDLWPMPSQ